jgi:hypothetical protein
MLFFIINIYVNVKRGFSMLSLNEEEGGGREG